MFGNSLRTKLLLPLLFGGVLMGVGGAWISYQDALSQLQNQLVHRGLQLGTAIDQSFLLAAQEFEMRFAVEEIVRQEHGISRITVATGNPLTIWASSFHPGADPDLATQTMLSQLSEAIGLGQFGHAFSDNGDLVLLVPLGWDGSTGDAEKAKPEETASPTEEGLDSIQLPVDSYRGAIYLRFDWQSIEEQSKGILWRSVSISVAEVVLIVLLALYLVRGVVLQQVRKIGGVIRRYEAGEHDARVSSSSGDEIGRVAQAFDEMLDSLQDSQELSVRIFRSSPALSEISRPEDGFHYDVNRAWIETLGYSHEEAMAHSVVELGVWAHPEDRVEFVKRLQRDGSVRNFEATFQTKDGRKLDVLVAGEYLELADEPRLLVVSHDITERKVMERVLRQTQKMEAVGQLTGGVAHDFNNLLAVIMGNAELLSVQLGEDNPKIQAVIRAATRGAELTQRLLAFSRKQMLQPQAIELNALVGGMIDLLGRTLGETIEIKTSSALGLWQPEVDPGQLESALLNLAINARDAMSEGGTLVIETGNASLDEAFARNHSDVTPGDYVMLAVSDSGSGMSPEVLEHVFEPFFTTKEVGQGSGLGLSMVYGFTKQSGGHVTIYSEEGRGTTVKLYLPRAEAAARCEEASHDQGVPQGRDEVILVIEDDRDVRALAVRMLEDLDYRVIDVPDAVAAHEALADGNPVDLVLSDVVLPGGTSGPEFAEQARTTYPDLKIIFISGYPAEAAKRNGFLGPGNVLLNKPFQRLQLAKALRDALD